MSRIGKQPIQVPDKVKVTINGTSVAVEGPKGKLEMNHHPKIDVAQDGGHILVTRNDDERASRSLHGLTRSLISNMVEGVTKGFEKKLEIVGVGYQASMQGKNLSITVGWANPLVVECPKELEVEVPDPTHIVIKGIDKQLVGQFAADIRKRKPPEPYKGKGIRYQNEQVRRKAGKALAGG